MQGELIVASDSGFPLGVEIREQRSGLGSFSLGTHFSLSCGLRDSVWLCQQSIGNLELGLGPSSRAQVIVGRGGRVISIGKGQWTLVTIPGL